MKKIYFLLFFIIVNYCGFAQQTADCRFPTSETHLNINNIKAHFSNGGDFWHDKSQGWYAPGYYVGFNEHGIKLSTIFSSSLWMGGLDESGGALKVAALTYRQNGVDFWPGPINSETKITNLVQCNNYDRHWKVNRVTVEKFIAGVELTDEQKQELYEWPGKGNPHLNFEHLNQAMAPFEDVDGDDIYNPDNGDYPIIKGDQAIWWLINDVGNTHTETSGSALGVEIKKMAYAFSSEQKLDNSTFIEVEVTNKSNNNYKDFVFGQWIDTDLGNYNDDFIGCQPKNALSFVYNGDDFDETPEGFGSDSPLQGFQYVNVPQDYYDNENDMYAFVYFNNDFSDIGNPQNAAHFYGYLNAKWKNGLSITKGKNGTDTLNPKTRYMYTGNPVDSLSWSECSVGNEPADRRLVMSSGKYKFAIGETKTWTLGAHTIHNVGGTCPDLQPLIDQAKYAKTFFERFLVTDIAEQSIDLKVYPNPVESKLFFNTSASIKSIEIFDLNGKLILQKNTTHNYLNVATLAKGLYYARLFTYNDSVYLVKFLKE